MHLRKEVEQKEKTEQASRMDHEEEKASGKMKKEEKRDGRFSRRDERLWLCEIREKKICFIEQTEETRRKDNFKTMWREQFEANKEEKKHELLRKRKSGWIFWTFININKIACLHYLNGSATLRCDQMVKYGLLPSLWAQLECPPALWQPPTVTCTLWQTQGHHQHWNGQSMAALGVPMKSPKCFELSGTDLGVSLHWRMTRSLHVARSHDNDALLFPRATLPGDKLKLWDQRHRNGPRKGPFLDNVRQFEKVHMW